MSLRDTLIDKLQKIERLPVSSVELLTRLQDDTSGVDDLAGLIDQDPSLLAALLAEANSAALRAATPVVRGVDAIKRLGRARISSLVTQRVFQPQLGQAVTSYDLPAEALWEQARARVVILRRLSLNLGIRVPPEASSAVLLLDLGKVALSQILEIDPGPVLKYSAREQVSFDVAEQKILGLDHAEAGALMLTAWGLPDSIVRLVRWHHRPDEAPKDLPGFDLVLASDSLVTMMGLGTGLDGLRYTVPETLFNEMGIDEELVETVFEQVWNDLAAQRNGLPQ